MRVTENMVNHSLRRNMQTRMEDYSKCANEISSGNKLTSLSENPDDLMLAMNMQSALNKQEQHKKNIESELSWLGLSETALTDTANIMVRAKELAIQAGGAGMGEMELNSLAMEIDELIDQTAINANYLLGRSHVFAGYRMDSQVVVNNDAQIPKNLFPPDNANIDYAQEQTFNFKYANTGESNFSYKLEFMDADGNIMDTEWQSGTDNQYTLPADTLGQGTYQWRVIVNDQTGQESVSDWGTVTAGTSQDKLTAPKLVGDKWIYENNDELLREVAPGITLSVNISGKAMYDTLQTLTDLKTALEKGDSKAATDLLGKIDDTHNSLVQQRTVVGARTKRLEDLKDMIEYQQIDMENLLAGANGVDMEEATIKLAEVEVAYQASLAVSAKLLGTNILDYLK